MTDHLKSMQKIDANLPGLAKHIEGLLQQIAGKNLPFALVIMPDVQGERVRYVSNTSPQSGREILKQMVVQWSKDEGKSKKVPFIPLVKVS